MQETQEDYQGLAEEEEVRMCPPPWLPGGGETSCYRSVHPPPGSLLRRRRRSADVATPPLGGRTELPFPTDGESSGSVSWLPG